MPKPSDFIFPYGEVCASGKLKNALHDFKVFEELGFEPTESGEHLYLFIEKTDTTTDSVNQSLARHYGVKPYHIGDCGLKDAKAVTRQWFSVHLPGSKEFPADPISDDYKILNKSWSHKKLKKGVHKGNTFQIKITEISGNLEKVKDQLEQIKRFGFVNYFGEQRFGRGKKNVSNAIEAFQHNKKLSRSKKSLYLSSLRSFLFNEVLIERLKKYDWKAPIAGDSFMLDGTRSIFSENINEDILNRYAEGDIHPIISLMGDGDDINTSQALKVENSIYAQYETIINLLKCHGLKRDKRAIRQNIKNLKYTFDKDSLELNFYLPKGSYATTFIQHFCQY